MYKIESRYTLDEAMAKLDKALIRHSFSTLSMYGFLGRINEEKNQFWIVNHSNTYRTRTGLKFKTYRRFDAYFIETLKGVTINGSFSIRPLYKIPLIIHFSFLVSIMGFALMFANDLITILKLCAMLVLMTVLGIAVIKINLKRTEDSDKEIIEFIEDVLGYNNDKEEKQ